MLLWECVWETPVPDTIHLAFKCVWARELIVPPFRVFVAIMVDTYVSLLFPYWQASSTFLIMTPGHSTTYLKPLTLQTVHSNYRITLKLGKSVSNKTCVFMYKHVQYVRYWLFMCKMYNHLLMYMYMCIIYINLRMIFLCTCTVHVHLWLTVHVLHM